MKKIFAIMLTLVVLTGCSEELNDGNMELDKGIPISEYLGAEVADIPDNVLNLIQEVPCWIVEKTEWAFVVEGEYYITDRPINNYFIGISQKDMVFDFNEDYTMWFRYVVQKDKLIPAYESIDNENIKTLYYGDGEFIFSTYNLPDNGEYEVPVFFAKMGSQDVLDKWNQQINGNI